MVQAQKWLDKYYPLESRKKVEKIYIGKRSLEGELRLEGFFNLTKLCCSSNQLTSLSIINCQKLQELDCSNNSLINLSFDNSPQLKEIDCSNNQLTSLEFIFQISDPKRLETLIINNNELVCNLSVFSSFTNLKTLKLGSNNFDANLEYLPHNLKKIYCQSCANLEEKLQGFEMGNKNEKCYDLKKWRLETYYPQAIKENKTEIIKKMIEELETEEWEIISNKKIDELGNMPLHYFAAQGNLEVTERIIKAWRKNSIEEIVIQQRLNIKGNRELSPLHVAISFKHDEIVKTLLEEGADPNVKDENGNTPLHFVAEENNLEMFKLLVEKGAEINAVNSYGWSVLHSVASGIVNKKIKWEIMKWLLSRKEEKNINFEIKSEDGCTVRDVFFQRDWSYAEHYDNLVESFVRNFQQEQVGLK